MAGAVEVLKEAAGEVGGEAIAEDGLAEDLEGCQGFAVDAQTMPRASSRISCAASRHPGR